jgi:hypothetical protein
MKIFVKPGKREGCPKQIFDGAIDDGDVRVEDGNVILSIIADDIYTAHATQRYTIVLDANDRANIFRAVG